jgi:hypothetical protein
VYDWVLSVPTMVSPHANFCVSCQARRKRAVERANALGFADTNFNGPTRCEGEDGHEGDSEVESRHEMLLVEVDEHRAFAEKATPLPFE